MASEVLKNLAAQKWVLNADGRTYHTEQPQAQRQQALMQMAEEKARRGSGKGKLGLAAPPVPLEIRLAMKAHAGVPPQNAPEFLRYMQLNPEARKKFNAPYAGWDLNALDPDERAWLVANSR